MMEQFRQEIVAVEVQRQSDIKAIVNELKGLMAQTEKNFLRIGKLLYEVYKNELYLQDGYKDFWDWFETQAFNFETRTARMLMRIWSYWGQGNAYRLSEAVLIEIGYTKAYMLTTLYDCGAIRSEEDLKQFIEFAKNTTTREFARLVSHHRGQQKKEEEAWITYKLRIPPDSADRLEEIVRGIAFLEGIDDEEEIKKRAGDLVLKALEDWYGYFMPVLYSNNLSSEERRQKYMSVIVKQLEGTFGVNVIVLKDGERIL